MATFRPYATQAFFFVNTDLTSKGKTDRRSNFFPYWNKAGKLYVTPESKNPDKYGAELRQLRAGSVVFAYENLVGIVAMGVVREKWDGQTVFGGTELYPSSSEMIRSVDVSWDTSVACSYKSIDEIGTANGLALRPIGDTNKLRLLMERLYDEAMQRRRRAGNETELNGIEHDIASARDGEALRRYRIGQKLFRDRVLAMEPACRVTGVANRDFLRASHIKPWAHCEEGEHLDAHNGFMLAPHVDHLFDKGFITFDDNGQLRCADSLDPSILRIWKIKEELNVGKFTLQQSRYLAYHRKNIFDQPRTK